MKRLFLLIALSLAVSTGSAFSAELLKVSRVEVKDIVQLYFTFNQPPRFSTSKDNRRIDLIFQNSSVGNSVEFPPPDGDIVKILPRFAPDKLIISLFFRYQPQNYTVSASDNNRVVFEVLLGNEYSKSYQELAEKLKGLTVLDRQSIDYSNPLFLSPYASDWKSFFSQYESEVSITVPVRFTMPPFPVIALLPPGKQQNLASLPPDVLAQAKKSNWDQVGVILLSALTKPGDLEQQKLLALTYGEALSRNNEFTGAYKQLYLLKETYPNELIGSYAGYLLALLRAAHGDPYTAADELKPLESLIGFDRDLRPYLHVSEVEAALATQDLQWLNQLLQQDNVGVPQQLQHLLDIRQADYWYAIKQPVKSYSSYKLVADENLLQQMPYSLNGFCNTFYRFKKFKEAAQCYGNLLSLVADKTELGLIAYRQAMAKLKFTDPPRLIDLFTQIETNFSDSEAGYRAAMKRLDLLLLTRMNWSQGAAKQYRRIGDKTVLRPVREEALFKEALVYAMMDDNDTAVKLTEQLLREFQTGSVRISAQALLIQRLPRLIKQLIDNKQYMEALVLAKKNREYFQKKWINSDFLVDIASAYQHLGIFDEAQRLYLYLIEIMPVDKREHFYLQMIQSTYEDGNYTLVDDYAAQYAYNYPKGKYADQILLLRIKSLIANEQIREAIALLPDPLPTSVDYLQMAGNLYFRVDNYQKCIECFLAFLKNDGKLTPNQQFMLAESFYRTGDQEQARNIFSQIPDTSPFYQQSLFRLAQIARAMNDDQNALTILQKLAETKESSNWKELAVRDLQLSKIRQPN